MQYIVDFAAQVILGGGSLVIIAFLLKHSDMFSDGNVGADDAD